MSTTERPRSRARLPFWLGAAGLALSIVGGGITLAGQVSDYGHPLPAFLAIESGLTAVLVLACLALLPGRERWRRVGTAILGAAALWMLVTAVGMVGEILASRSPAWLPVDCAVTAATGGLWSAAAVAACREGRRDGGRAA